MHMYTTEWSHVDQTELPRLCRDGSARRDGQAAVVQRARIQHAGGLASPVKQKQVLEIPLFSRDR